MLDLPDALHSLVQQLDVSPHALCLDLPHDLTPLIMAPDKDTKVTVGAPDQNTLSTTFDTEDIAVGTQETLRDRKYLQAGKWTIFYRSVLLQMILFGW